MKFLTAPKILNGKALSEDYIGADTMRAHTTAKPQAVLIDNSAS